MSTDSFGVADKSANPGPASSLDIYDEAVSGADETSIETNLGLGNYSPSEMYQQVQSYQKGMFADAALSRVILKRAILEARLGEGLESWRDLKSSKQETKDKWSYVRRMGRARWDEMDEQQRMEAVEKHAGIPKDWTPPFHEMLAVRHEATRSRKARLIDNLFGRVVEKFQSYKGESNSNGFQLGKRSNGGDRPR
jgi:hypothetical protein